jgi:hypothetical protein
MDKSRCCNAPVKIGGEGETHYFVCTKCYKPCDLKIVDNQPDNSNHKGEFCPYRKTLLCQEGYCNKCAVWIKWCEELWK